MTTIEHAATEKSRLTQAAGKVTGKLWCGYHQGYAEAATGHYQLRNQKKRWLCAACLKTRGIAPAAEK